MISLNVQLRVLAADELDTVTGGLSLSFAALNPQPIPPGRLDFALLHQGALALPRLPGCPGPVILPPSPC